MYPPPPPAQNRGILLLCLVVCAVASACFSETWRGLTVAPEYRCSAYDRKDYLYWQSVEADIVADLGGRVYGPYTGRTFAGTRKTDIEHIVALSEAHDSGLCAADKATRRRFANDLFNLTLAAPEVNRCGRGGKCARDAAEWMPEMNRCWFAARVVAVRRKYGLTVDRSEADALERVLSGCSSMAMIFPDRACKAETFSPSRGVTLPSPDADALALWDDNGNGRIACEEARRHGIAPVKRGHPAYPFMFDGDSDGVVCE